MYITEAYINNKVVLNEGVLDVIKNKFGKYVSMLSSWKSKNDAILDKHNIEREKQKKQIAKTAVLCINKVKNSLVMLIRKGDTKSIKKSFEYSGKMAMSIIKKQVAGTTFGNITGSLLQGAVLALVTSLAILFLETFLSGLVAVGISKMIVGNSVLTSNIVSLIAKAFQLLTYVVISWLMVPIIKESARVLSVVNKFSGSFTVAISVMDCLRMSAYYLATGAGQFSKVGTVMSLISNMIINVIQTIISFVSLLPGFGFLKGWIFVLNVIVTAFWNETILSMCYYKGVNFSSTPGESIVNNAKEITNDAKEVINSARALVKLPPIEIKPVKSPTLIDDKTIIGNVKKAVDLYDNLSTSDKMAVDVAQKVDDISSSISDKIDELKTTGIGNNVISTNNKFWDKTVEIYDNIKRDSKPGGVIRKAAKEVINNFKDHSNDVKHVSGVPIKIPGTNIPGVGSMPKKGSGGNLFSLLGKSAIRDLKKIPGGLSKGFGVVNKYLDDKMHGK